MRILFVISELTYHGAAKQLILLAKQLVPARFERRVCVLGKAGPWADTLRAEGVIFDVLNWRWQLDLPAYGRLRHLLRAYQADLLHIWGLPVLRTVSLAGGLGTGRLVVSLPLRARGEHLRWWDGWLLRRAEWVTVASPVEAVKWRGLEIDVGRLAVIPPGVDMIECSGVEGSNLLPPRTILCVGPLKPGKGFRDAIWVLDILRHLHSDLQLAFVGSGPDRPAIERFAHDARVADRVHFLGDCADLPALLARAELVWAPSRAASGVNAVLEAMAAGKPVVASELPEMAEIVVSGETGYLTPPGDQAAFARQTRVLLDDADLRRRMGEAGRHRALERFSAAAMARAFTDLYEKRSESAGV
jgi:glycosyltransferase involved in cell wall biosynthesis